MFQICISFPRTTYNLSFLPSSGTECQIQMKNRDVGKLLLAQNMKRWKSMDLYFPHCGLQNLSTSNFSFESTDLSRSYQLIKYENDKNWNTYNPHMSSLIERSGLAWDKHLSASLTRPNKCMAIWVLQLLLPLNGISSLKPSEPRILLLDLENSWRLTYPD